jgi:hypothetical protein
VSPARPRGGGTLDALRELLALRTMFGPAAARRRRALIAALDRTLLPDADSVLRLHEALCFACAYPDDARVLAAARRALARFGSRPDLRRHARRLESSGIAGTVTRFRFFAPTAFWLARHWPDALRVEWAAFEHADRLAELLPHLAHDAEAPGLDEYDLGTRGWVQRMKGPDETDAAFLARRFQQLRLDPALLETLYDSLDPPLVLHPGPGTPQRSTARAPVTALRFQRRPLRRERPDLASEARHPPRAVRARPVAAGRRLIDLARVSMVTRERDLDAFANADARDVRWVEFGDGLAFACLGVVPERRLLLEAVYGFLTLRNGVPTGYVLASALYGSCEVAYNVFDTFRGADAAWTYARALSMARALFGADAFTIVPYQLGQDNEEAIASGAWWFYAKLGFRPRDPRVARVYAAETLRMGRVPSHRSTPATLRRLASAPLHLFLGRKREDVLGRVPLANVGIAVTDLLARRFGSDRAAADRVCAAEAAARLGIRVAGGTRGERLAWRRWAPVVLLLPRLERWREAERRALLEVIRAKGGLRESDFVRRFDAHPRLRAAIRDLAEANAPG